MNNKKSALASKTFWVNLLVLIAGVAGYLAGNEWVASNPQVVAILAAVVGLVNIALRFMTDKPIDLGLVRNVLFQIWGLLNLIKGKSVNDESKEE